MGGPSVPLMLVSFSFQFIFLTCPCVALDVTTSFLTSFYVQLLSFFPFSAKLSGGMCRGGGGSRGENNFVGFPYFLTCPLKIYVDKL